LDLISNPIKNAGFILFACGDEFHYVDFYEPADCVSETTETISEILWVKLNFIYMNSLQPAFYNKIKDNAEKNFSSLGGKILRKHVFYPVMYFIKTYYLNLGIVW
jgi:hypothetical protein